MVPTGVTTESGAYTPDQCQNTLIDENPSYASLRITQKPSWVRTPTSYAPNSKSSPVVAFEDPDRIRKRELLAAKQLFRFGIGAKLEKGKQVPRPKDTDRANQLPPAPTDPESALEPLTLEPLKPDTQSGDNIPSCAPPPLPNTRGPTNILKEDGTQVSTKALLY